MAYKVFISHSTRDRGLVISLAQLFTKLGMNVFVAEWILSPGTPLERKVFSNLEKADCVVVLLTQNGIRSNWVQQEVGFALKTKKHIIPLVEKGVNVKDLGVFAGKDYIGYDPRRPQEALVKAARFVASLKVKKEEQERMLLVGGGILTFLVLLSGGEK